MRLIVGISLLLVGIGLWSCQMQGAANEPAVAPPAIAWVRTIAGWERPAAWQLVPPAPPTLHPLVVATGQLLASALALVAFRRNASGSAARASAAGCSLEKPDLSGV